MVKGEKDKELCENEGCTNKKGYQRSICIKCKNRVRTVKSHALRDEYGTLLKRVSELEKENEELKARCSFLSGGEARYSTSLRCSTCSGELVGTMKALTLDDDIPKKSMSSTARRIEKRTKAPPVVDEASEDRVLSDNGSRRTVVNGMCSVCHKKPLRKGAAGRPPKDPCQCV